MDFSESVSEISPRAAFRAALQMDLISEFDPGKLLIIGFIIFESELIDKNFIVRFVRVDILINH